MDLLDDPLRLYLTHQAMKKIRYARSLRRVMTEAETRLWTVLRRRGNECKIRRQVPLGRFIADFCCMQHRLIIEVDGGIHNASKEYDHERSEILSAGEFTIIRFNNEEIFTDLRNVLRTIREHCSK